MKHLRTETRVKLMTGFQLNLCDQGKDASHNGLLFVSQTDYDLENAAKANVSQCNMFKV